MVAPFYSFWLIPQEPDLSYFQTLISGLANRFGTVSFCPHVTLYSGFVPTDLDIQQRCAVLANCSPIGLEVVHLAHETRFSKTLYVQLRTALDLTQLVDRLMVDMSSPQTTTLDPHVSLLYHQLDTAIKETLVKKITLPRTTIRFNQLQVIAAPQNFETQEHVSKLRHVHSQFLNTL